MKDHIVLDDPMDVRRDWAAYKRMKRQEREQRTAVWMVSIAVVVGIVMVLASLVVAVRRDIRERAELGEMLGGVK